MKYSVTKKEVEQIDLSALCKLIANDIASGKIKLRQCSENKSETF